MKKKKKDTVSNKDFFERLVNIEKKRKELIEKQKFSQKNNKDE